MDFQVKESDSIIHVKINTVDGEYNASVNRSAYENLRDFSRYIRRGNILYGKK